MDVINKIYEAILEGKYTEIGEYIEKALKERRDNGCILCSVCRWYIR